MKDNRRVPEQIIKNMNNISKCIFAETGLFSINDIVRDCHQTS